MNALIAAIDLADVALAVGLMALAIALLFAEVLLPSFGLLTITALACAGVAIHIAFGASATFGVVLIVATVLVSPFLGYLAIKVARKTPLILRDEPGPPERESGEVLGLSVGDRGVALTPLRPAGAANFGGSRVDVVTRGEAIAPGEQVEVLRIEGNRTVVRAVVA